MQRINVGRLNDSRRTLGLPRLHSVWCPICKQQNSHFWFDCRNLRCPVFYGKHPAYMCVMSMPASGADQHSIPRVNVVTELDYPRRLLVPEDALGVAG